MAWELHTLRDDWIAAPEVVVSEDIVDAILPLSCTQSNRFTNVLQ